MQSHIFFSILPSRPVEKPSRDQRNFLKSRGGLPLVAGWGSTYRPRSYRPPPSLTLSFPWVYLIFTRHRPSTSTRAYKRHWSCSQVVQLTSSSLPRKNYLELYLSEPQELQVCGTSTCTPSTSSNRYLRHLKFFNNEINGLTSPTRSSRLKIIIFTC